MSSVSVDTSTWGCDGSLVGRVCLESPVVAGAVSFTVLSSLGPNQGQKDDVNLTRARVQVAAYLPRGNELQLKLDVGCFELPLAGLRTRWRGKRRVVSMMPRAY